VQNVVNRFALVIDHARRRFHGDDFERAYRVEVTQPAVGHRTDAARSAPEKSPSEALTMVEGTAHFPPDFACFPFEGARAYARFANRDPAGLYGVDVVHVARSRITPPCNGTACP